MRTLALLAALGLISLVTLRTLVWPAARDEALDEWSARLSSLADDRQHAIDAWIGERVGDARVVANYPTVHYLLGDKAGIDAPFPRQAGPEAHLGALLSALREAYGYRTVAVFDAAGDMVVANTDDPSFPDAACREAARIAIETGGSAFDIHVHGNGVTFTVAEPVLVDATGRVAGALVLEMDAGGWLYPFLAKEAVPTRTGETLLVLARGDDIVFVSPLRHLSSPPTGFTLPTATQDLAGAVAVAGGGEFGLYRDYRDEAILAVPRGLGRPGWGLVAKVDASEAFAEARGRTWNAAVLLALASICVVAIAYAAWHRHRRILSSHLEQQSRDLARALEDLPDVLFLLDRDGSIREVWGDVQGIYGRDAESLRGRQARDARAPGDTGRFERDLMLAWQKETHRYDSRHVGAEGRTLDVEIATRKIRFGDEELLLGMVRDVTDRRLAERHAVLHNRLLRLLSAVNEAMVRATEPSPFLKRICELGLVPGDLAAAWVALRDADGSSSVKVALGLTSDLALADPEALLSGPVAQTLRDGVSARGETRAAEARWARVLRDRDVELVVAMPLVVEGVVVGAYVLAATDGAQLDPEHQPLLDELASDVGFALTTMEVRRREAEALLHVRKFSRAVEQASSAIVITDADGRIEYVNQSFTWITGYSSTEAVGKTPQLLKSGLTPASLYVEMWGALKAGREWHGELRNRRKDGELYWADLAVAPLRDEAGRVTHFIAVQQDVTSSRLAQDELNSLQAQLAQSQRLEAIGRLAGGIAHDFNNLLGIVTGCADFLLRRDLDAHVKHKLEQIVEAGQRAAGLTRQLLAFSRRQVLEPRVVEMRTALEGCQKLLHRTMGEDVTLRFDVAPDLGRVKVDPSQLDQVILNLAVNARDAMPRGGEFRVEADNVVVGSEQTQRERMRPGRYVRLVATDSGTGIEAEHLSHLFEPFFTTKPVEKGTGLGLATVYGIVKQSGGYVAVRSTLGEGTSFSIYLPRVADEAEAEEVSAAVAPAAGERILLVEDQAALRELVAEMLDTLGYTVVAASGGEQALAAAAGQEPFDLLLTDVVMPGMGGPELADRLAQTQPGLRVLFMSGYADEVVLQHGLRDERIVMLSKPFTIEGLASRVRGSLRGEPPRPRAREA